MADDNESQEPMTERSCTMDQQQLRGLPPPRQPTINSAQRKESAYDDERPP